MAFSIKFLPDSCQDIKHGPMEAIGERVLGDSGELFLAELSFWTKAQYEAQWREGLNRIVRNLSPSCLIHTMRNPVTARFIFWWPMWRQDDEIVFQESTIWLKEHKERFDPSNPYGFIPEYSNMTEEGEKVSEWRVSVDDVYTFLEQSGWSR